MNTDILHLKFEALKRQPTANPAVLDAIRAWVLQSEPLERLRINPYQVAQAIDVPPPVLVPQFLYGVRSGLFDMVWDAHCPHCNMISGAHENLQKAASTYFCPMCERHFENDFAKWVEVSFILNKEIEDLNLPPMCPPPPHVESHFQMIVPRNETGWREDVLQAGEYRYSCPITNTFGKLTVAGEPTTEVQEFLVTQLADERFDHAELTARPGPIRFGLKNEGYPLGGLVVLDWNLDLPELSLDDLPPRLSGLEIIHYPAFSDLFGDQVLSDRERIKISSVTTVFTDITGSTRMYEQLGDAVAYNIVRDHFDILFQAVRNNGGTVLKTIGDAVMASFTSNALALDALLEAFEQFEAYNQDREQAARIRIKVGLHRGPAILVTLNGQLDYFGSTINKAARIQGVSGSREITFSQEIFADEAFRRKLEGAGIEQMAETSVNLRGLEGAHTVYKVVVGQPPYRQA